jgi:putative DNA primase/helicase
VAHMNVLNGTIDLHTGELREHARQDYLSKLSAVAFDPNAECELWDAFLWRITDRNEELYRYLRRLVGYMLTGTTTEQVLHFLFGLGANGKSVFIEIVSALLGDYAVVVSPDLIMLKRHGGIPNDVARLRGARAALMNETTQGAKFDEAKLKDLTGGDSLTARFLHREFFEFSPTHTVSIPADQQDRELLTKLRAELPGILKWAVDGCIEWQHDGLRPPSCVMEAVQEYRCESDTLGRFIAECCEVRKLGQVKSSALYQRYQSYCEKAGERWVASKDLPHEMQRRGFDWKRTKEGGLFMGLEFSSAAEPDWRDQ